MKEKKFSIEIRQPESRLERERREKLRRAEVVYGVLTWVMLLAGLGLAVAGILRNVA